MARRKNDTESVETTEGGVAVATDTVEVKESKPEVVVDLTAFQAAVDAALAASDPDTGTVPEANLAEVQHAYRELPTGKPKSEARKLLNEGMRTSMTDGNIASARAYMSLSDDLSAPAPKAPREPKAPANPTDGFVAKVAGIQLAYTLVTGDVPEGVDADWSEKVNAALAEAMPQIDAFKAWSENEDEDKGEAPETGYVARTALKIAAGKAPGAKASTGGGSTYQGERRDVAVHIQSAFENELTGKFLSVAEIRKFKSAEYGDDAPSAGAISARLFPKSGTCTVEGIEPGTNDKGVRGATKL